MSQSVLDKVEYQLKWRDKSGKKLSNIVLTREEAESLLTGPYKPFNAPLEELKGIHESAKRMLANGYKGQGLNDEVRAHDYIVLAADNPAVEDELNEQGFAFWRACTFQFRVWMAHKRQAQND
jgi:hypothetical protein